MLIKQSLSFFCWQKYRKRENFILFRFYSNHLLQIGPLCSELLLRLGIHKVIQRCVQVPYGLKSSLLASYGSQTLYSEIKVAFIPSVYPVPPRRVFLHFCFLNTTQLISSEKTCDSPKFPLAGWFFKAWKWNPDERMRWRSLVLKLFVTKTSLVNCMCGKKYQLVLR